MTKQQHALESFLKLTPWIFAIVALVWNGLNANAVDKDYLEANYVPRREYDIEMEYLKEKVKDTKTQGEDILERLNSL